MFSDKIYNNVKEVEICKVNHRPRKNSIGQYFISVDYFYPLYEGGIPVRRGRILFFDSKKSAKEVIVGYKIRV